MTTPEEELYPSRTGFRRPDMIEAVKILQDYWNTYDKQSGYKDYHVDTFIDDALYGLGIAIDKSQFEFASGYDKFKVILREHLMPEEPEEKEAELYVLVFDQGLRGWPSDKRELFAGSATSIAEIKALKKQSGNTYGKTRIAKLQFVEEE